MRATLQLFSAGLAMVIVACTALTVSATQYPPGPSGSCPDTLTLFQIQNPALSCHPASGDTVRGIRGIVTGFDKDVTPYGFWIQVNSSAWSGAQVFTGATNYFNAVPGTPSGGNLRIGDDVVMYGRVVEFGGMTELLDFDNNQSTNDIIIRRLSSFNPTPAYHIGTTTELNWNPAISAATAEPWEGTLVKVRGPLTVRRNSSALGLGSRSFLAVYSGAPNDSLAVDGFSLTDLAAPAVGTVIDSVQGILTQVTISGVNSYRILLRDRDDLFGQLPPHVTDAYPIEDNLIRVIFDGNVTLASAQNVSHYSLGSSGLINSATLVGGVGRVVVLNVSNGLSDGANESVTVSGVVGASGGIPMTAPETRSFINGVLTLAAIQSPDPAALAGSPCKDRSRFALATGASGARVSYRGVVVGAFGTVYYLSDPVATATPRAALPVFGVPQALSVGRRYLIAGQVQEFDGISTTMPDGLTEGVSVVYVQDEGPAALPAAALPTIPSLNNTTCDVSQAITNAEDYEGVLVRLASVRVVEERSAGQSFLVGTPAGAPTDFFLVANTNNVYSFDPDSNDVLDVTGLITFRSGAQPFRILPRGNADIVELPNRAPTVDALPSVIAIQGTTVRLTPIGRDLDGDPLSWTLLNLPGDVGDFPGGVIDPTGGGIEWSLAPCEPLGERLGLVVVQDGRGGADSSAVRVLVRPMETYECTADFEDQFKYMNVAMDANGNFVNDALDALNHAAPDTINVLVRTTECIGPAEMNILATRGRVVYLSPYINIVFMRMVAAQFDTVALLPFIAFLDPDAPVVGTLETSTRAITVRKSDDYSLDTIEDMYPEFDGSGVTIAFLDTGIDDGGAGSIGTVHEALPGSKYRGGGVVMGGQFFALFSEENADDLNGHGTHIAAIALGVGRPDGTRRGVAPGADLVDIRTMSGAPGAAPTGFASAQILAIDWCITNRAAYNIKVINIAALQPNATLGVNYLRSINRAVQEGIIVVVPAGNSGPGNPSLSFPATSPNVLTVGASAHMNTVSRDDDAMADFSSRSGTSTTKPEIVAPGTDFPTGGNGIVSAQFNTASGYVAKQGTSAAAAHVSGLAAIFMQALPDMTPDTFRQLLVETADDIGTTLFRTPAATTLSAPSPQSPQLVPARLVNGFRALRKVVVPRTDLGFTLHARYPGPELAWLTDEVRPTNPQICPLVQNPVIVTVTNFGPNPAVDFEIKATEMEGGNITAESELGRTLVTTPLPVGQTVAVSFPWTPRQHNRSHIHKCLRGYVSYGGDLNPINDLAQRNIDYGFCSPERHRMKVVNRTRQNVQVTLAHSFATGTGWTIECSEPSFSFPMLANEVPRYVEFFIRPTVSASDTAAVDVDVMAETVCGPQSMGGNRMIAVRSHYVDVPAADAGRVTSLRFSPNPFASRFTIQMSLPIRQRVDVDVYDVAGRLVRRLGGHEMPAGESEIVWDGKTQERARAGAGLYFIRVRTLDRLETKPVICLR